MLQEREGIHIVPVSVFNLLLEPALFLVAAVHNVPDVPRWISITTGSEQAVTSRVYLHDDVAVSILSLLTTGSTISFHWVSQRHSWHGSRRRTITIALFHLREVSDTRFHFILEVNRTFVEP